MPTSTLSKPQQSRGAIWGPWRIFAVAFVLRLLVITLGHFYHFRAEQDHNAFGNEMGHIARALATGYGYADPFYGHTGPTSWVTPLYPLILAGVFKLFGVYTDASGWVILAINSLFNAAIIPMLWHLGRRCFNEKVARWSAWIWALYPAAMQYAVKWVWEMSVTCFLFTAVFLLAVKMRGIGDSEAPASASTRPRPTQTLPRWLLFGLLWGLIALSNPSLLLFLPVCGLWVLSGAGRSWVRYFPQAFVAGLIFFAVLAPWSYRNYRAFHTFVPLRANFGAELYLGNGPGATGFLMEYDHPDQAVDQYRLYKQMGEVQYAKMRGAVTIKLIRQDPARFLRLCLTRVYFFWFGIPAPDSRHAADPIFRGINYSIATCAGLLGLALALRRRIPASGLMAAAFLLLPAVYYIVTAHARFRHPLEPLITLLGVYLFQSAEHKRPI